jgi:hypothetical protein
LAFTTPQAEQVFEDGYHRPATTSREPYQVLFSLGYPLLSVIPVMMESTMRDGAGYWDVEFYDFVSGSPRAVEGLPGFGDLHERAVGNGARHGQQVHDVQANLARRRTARSHMRIKYLEADFAAMLVNALGGLRPDGTADVGYRGRELARNAAITRMVLATGLRRREFTPAADTTPPAPSGRAATCGG